MITHGKSLRKTVDNLQTLMAETETWFNNWRIHPNPLKTQFLIFNHVPSNTSPSISIGNHQIRPSLTAKYLGVLLDHKLNLKHHTKLIKRRITTRAKHFRTLTYNNKGINIQTASKIYTSICRPILEYGHVLYLNCRLPTLINIKTAETTALRIVTKLRHPTNSLHNPANELLYNKTHVQPILERLKKLSSKFAKSHHNIEIMQHMFITRTRNQLSKFKFPERTLQEILKTLSENP